MDHVEESQEERRELERRYHREYEIFAVELLSGARQIRGTLGDIHESGMSFFLNFQEAPPVDVPLADYLGLDGKEGRVLIRSQVLKEPFEIDTRIIYQAKSVAIKDRYLIGLEFNTKILLPDAILAIALQED